MLIKRINEEKIHEVLLKKKSVLLLGPRQTGKTTLLSQIPTDLSISLVQPEKRLLYARNPGYLTNQVETLAQQKKEKGFPLVLIDEVQRAPDLMDAAQDLIDRKLAIFILTGSSARKLKHGPNVNMLPGRVIPIRMDPLNLYEQIPRTLDFVLTYGSLPGIISRPELSDIETELQAYVTIYLEEEVRAEALVRNVGHFAHFLELAASESGNVTNFSKLSQDIGVSHQTISAYYQILEDCLIAERVEPLTKSKTRKKLTRSQRYLLFDMGVRRLAANEGTQPSKERQGQLFEQFVGLELIRLCRTEKSRTRVLFWRDPEGPEVDWVLDQEGSYTPIEVKLTDTPRDRDLRYLRTFLSEYPTSKEAFVVCQCSQRILLEKNIWALPWQELPTLMRH